MKRRYSGTAATASTLFLILCVAAPRFIKCADAWQAFFKNFPAEPRHEFHESTRIDANREGEALRRSRERARARRSSRLIRSSTASVRLSRTNRQPLDSAEYSSSLQKVVRHAHRFVADDRSILPARRFGWFLYEKRFQSLMTSLIDSSRANDRSACK